MDSKSPEFKEEPIWNPPEDGLERVQTRDESPGADPTRRKQSSATSVSSRSTGDSTETSGRGRRARPSQASSGSLLTAVSEASEKRGLSPVPSAPSIRIEEEEAVVSSKKVLTSFSKVASRNIEKEAARKKLIDHYAAENNYQKTVLDRLIKSNDTKPKTMTQRLLGWVIPSYRQTKPPHREELISLIQHHFVPRSSLLCHVCDFGENRAEHNVVQLGSLEDYWSTKPDWVDVRWIHAPLGLGLTHSSVEDIFLHEGDEGREFTFAGRSGWPYLETEVINLRARQNFQETRDVWALLHQRQDLHDELNESTWRDERNVSLKHDILWRADHLATEPTFWNLTASDMPWQLTEGMALGSQGPLEGLSPISRHVEHQTLSMHPFYRHSQTVRSPFRTFHRADGFLLTLSPMVGVNYLDKNFARHLNEPLDAMFDNDDASAIGQAFSAFAANGTSTWHRRSVEWFLIYLLTEIGTTPHPFRQGFNAPSVETSYSSVIQDLKRRRYEKWQPKQTIKLVRDYLSCIDEVTTIKLITHKRLDLFKVLQQDLQKFEAEDTRMGNVPDRPDGESSLERLDWAIKTIKTQAECFDRLLIDLRQSMDALFQLRSIEQNELAIVSDSQNKAIIVFTIVTIIFLPLSFFTSYYGMNLQGIVDTKRGQGYFWKVCGSVGLAIVLCVSIAAFRHRAKQIMRGRVGKAPRAMV